MCIGAPRAATTWVHKQLGANPGVFLPKRKEIHFYDEPLPGVAVEDSDLRWSETFFFDVDRAAHQRWYWYQFRHAGSRLAGDITPLYSTLSEGRIRTIFEHNPDLKIIYILRNPVERAWSGVRKSVWYQKGETFLDDKDEAWILEKIMRPEVLIRGDYPRAIKNWEAVFPQEQIQYLFHDDIEADSDKVLTEISDFLGLVGTAAPAQQPRSRRVNAAPQKAMPEHVRAALLDYYRPQIAVLEQKFERDLSSWRR